VEFLELVHAFSPGKLLSAAVRVHSFSENLPTKANAHFKPNDYAETIREAEFIKGQAEKFDLDVGLAGIERVLQVLALAKSNTLPGHLTLNGIECDLLQSACLTAFAGIRDGLVKRLAIAIEPAKTKYYLQPEPLFGPEVDSTFPGLVAEDISEAGKCLALDRGTACVFHLSRAMEAVVQKLGAKLAVTLTDKNNVDLDWGVIIANMRLKVEAMPKGPLRDEWSEHLSLLAHVKQAWRHPTMHPKQTYTPEEAGAVFDAVKSFMRHLAGLICG
jgi:hypothetical protein